jgi:hypothetical protein
VNTVTLRRSIALVAALGVIAVPSALAGGSHHDGARHGSGHSWSGHERTSDGGSYARHRGERTHRWSGERTRTRGGGCSRHQDPPPVDPPPVDPPVDPPPEL